MSKLIDLTGRQFDFWTVVGRGRTEPNGTGTRVYWICRCVCGNQKELKGDVLKRGRSQSCGCKTSQLIAAEKTRHGNSRRRQPPSGTYTSWANMIQRCSNPNSKDFPYYGGRGITVTRRWLEFKNFLVDMGDRPVGMTIERKDNNLGYERSNCIWADRKQQSKNRRNVK